MLLHRNLPVYLIGIIEGIIIPLSIYSFLLGRGVNDERLIIYTIIISSLFALLMCAGAYFTREEELDHKKNNKILKIYNSLDIDESITNQMAKDTLAENEDWQKKWEDGANVTSGVSSGMYGALIFFGYATGIFVVAASAFIFKKENFEYVYLPMCALFIAAFIKYKLQHNNALIRSTFITLTGLAAAFGAYYVAGLF